MNDSVNPLFVKYRKEDIIQKTGAMNRRPAAIRIQAAFSGPVALGRESVPAAGAG